MLDVPNPPATDTVAGDGPKANGDPGKGSTRRVPVSVELAVPPSFRTPTAAPNCSHSDEPWTARSMGVPVGHGPQPIE